MLLAQGATAQCLYAELSVRYTEQARERLIWKNILICIYSLTLFELQYAVKSEEYNYAWAGY